jgi:hypothetical protein
VRSQHRLFAAINRASSLLSGVTAEAPAELILEMIVSIPI